MPCAPFPTGTESYRHPQHKGTIRSAELGWNKQTKRKARSHMIHSFAATLRRYSKLGVWIYSSKEKGYRDTNRWMNKKHASNYTVNIISGLITRHALDFEQKFITAEFLAQMNDIAALSTQMHN